MNLKKFANLPITSKLRHLQAVTVGLALVLVLLASTAAQLWYQQRQMLDDIGSTGKMIGFNVVAAMRFNDREAATDTLAALRSKTNIIAAGLYTSEGVAYAQYLEEDHRAVLPETLAEAQRQVQQDAAAQFNTYVNTYAVLQPVEQNAEIVGYLFMLIDLQPMWTAIANNLGQISLVMLVAFQLSVLFGQRLAALISLPLIRLAEITNQVSQEKNYTLRAKDEGADEIGQLVTGFNRMIEQVQYRDSELANHRDRLEEEVETRTRDLREAVAEAQAASIAKSRFLATMSHEIRTPMNGVLGMAELLLASDLMPSQRRLAEMALKSGESLLAIIDDILDFSKIEAGYLELEQVEFSVYKLVEDIVDLFVERAQSKELDLSFRITASVPNSVMGDATRIRQILGNLISNAIKFTRHGEIVINLALLTNTGKDVQVSVKEPFLLSFAVQDTGVGIEELVLPRLFQAFSQADSSTTRQYGGTGLGLAISRQLAELMGGSIAVSTQPGQGSVFTVLLPLFAPYYSNETAEFSPELAGLRLLIVGYPGNESHILQQYCLSWKMQVDVLSGKAVVLGLLKQTCTERHKAYDLILMDMNMADSLELGQLIGVEPELAGIPLVLLAATMFKNLAAEIKRSGFAAYLIKPVRKADLRLALSTALAAKVDNKPSLQTGLQDASLGCRILLVEDNPVNQELTKLMLQRYGCSVDICNTGIEALHTLKHTVYDLVLMDCMMPEMDGYEATSEIRRLQQIDKLPYFPIIALTANVIEGDREKCLEAGMDDYLSKPFKAESLLNIISSWLRHIPQQPGITLETEAPDMSRSTINESTLEAIRTLDDTGNGEFLPRLIRVYLANAEQTLQNLDSHWKAGELAGIRESCHALKSSSSQMGADGFASLCREVENAARNQCHDGADAMLMLLKQEYSKVKQALTAYLD